MKIRRKQGSRPLRTLTAKSLVLTFAIIVVIVYLVTFAKLIGSEDNQRNVRGEIVSSLENAHLGQPLEIVTDHDETDQSAIKILRGKEQDHEIAPRQEQSSGDAAAVATIGYAVTITGCGKEPMTEGAAVLKHSIHLASIHGKMGGRYDYQMYAIYHPEALKCAKTLESLGYKLVERNTPVAVKDIQGDYLRSKIEANGCCGEKELIKLEAYTLTQHPAVVHLDLDTLILQPLDGLFDWMLAGDKARSFDSGVSVQFPEDEIPEKINAFFTRDFNMGGAKKKRLKPVQGGFLVLRPDMNVYNEFVEIIRKGHFTADGGWGGECGVFYGSMTFQGIIPYFYDILNQGEAVELNHCVYNQMADNPRNKRTVNDVVNGKCMTGEDDCEDCRSRPLEEVLTAHFTLCQKPWWCLPQDEDKLQQRLCRKLHHQWYRIRSELEESWGRTGIGEGDYQKEHFYGHCKSHSKNGYIYIQEPFGMP